MKLFLLHAVLLTKLPLKYRAQSVNSTLLDEFCETQDGKVYPFHEVSEFVISRTTNRLKREFEIRFSCWKKILFQLISIITSWKEVPRPFIWHPTG